MGAWSAALSVFEQSKVFPELLSDDCPLLGEFPRLKVDLAKNHGMNVGVD